MKRVTLVLTVLVVLGLTATTAQAYGPATAAIQMSAGAVSHGPGPWGPPHHGYARGHHWAPPPHAWYRPPVVVPVPMAPPPPVRYYYAPPVNSVYFGSPGFSIGIGF